MGAPQNLRSIGDRIEQQLDELRATANPRAYDQAEDVLRLVTELYGAALERVMAVAGELAPEVVQVLLDDELIASLLVVHGLHPDDLATRVAGALESVRPFLGQHGGDVELLDIDEAAGAVHLRLLGSCDGCPSSAITLRTSVERAIVEAAPEIVTIDVDEPAAQVATPDADGTIPIALGRKPVQWDPATGCGTALESTALEPVAP